MKKLSLLVAVAALAAPGTAAAARHSGIVVKADVNAHVLVVAQKAGRVVRVHAPASRFARNGKRFRVGQRISFTARKLRNGTLAGRGFRVTGHASRVIVHGIVRAYDARKQRITLATGGALLRMKLARTGARTLMTAAPPKVGDEVTVTASVDENDDTLEATEVDEDEVANDAQAGEGDDQQADENDDQQAEQDDQSEDDSDQASDSGSSSGDDASSDDDGSDGSGSGDEGGG